jgi:ferredoxin-NADP reductase
MQVTFDHSQDETPHIKTFWFRPEQPVRYVAGQFIELYLPHTADARGVKRWFTLSSSPTDPLLSITTKFAVEHSSTFKQTLLNLAPGTELRMVEPMGDFVLPKDKTIPLVFVAGGIGITPMHSMLRWLEDTGERRRITVLYAVNQLEELIFEPVFGAAGTKLIPIVGQPQSSWHGEMGRLSAERIIQLARPSGRSLIYISGPELMVEALVKDLSANGVDEKQLVGDYFPGYPTA